MPTHSDQQSHSGLPQGEWTLLREIVLTDHDVCCVVDTDNQIRLINERGARLVLGLSAGEAVGRNLHECFAPEMVAWGEKRGREGIARRQPSREVAMVRARCVTTTLIPLHVPSDGDLLLLRSRVADPVRTTLERALQNRETYPVPTAYSPFADLGYLAALDARQLRIARELARGYTESEVAANLFIPEGDVRGAIRDMGRQLGWHERRGVATHAYAMGLHLYDDDYFSDVVLEACAG